MSYDLDALHQKYGIQVASVKFGSSAERSSIALIAAVAGATPIIHQVACAASAFAIFQLGQSTAAGTMTYLTMCGNTPQIEGVRIVNDSSAVVNLFATGDAGVDAGSGFFRVYFSLQRSPAGAAGGGLNL